MIANPKSIIKRSKIPTIVSRIDKLPLQNCGISDFFFFEKPHSPHMRKSNDKNLKRSQKKKNNLMKSSFEKYKVRIHLKSH